MKMGKVFLYLMVLIFSELSQGSTKGMNAAEAQSVSVSVMAAPAKVYEYAADAENLPKWASGLSKSKLEKSGDSWVADSPMGKVKVKFAEKNSLGILDHDVTLPDGTVAHNPLRVVKNNDGSEVIFTVFRQKGMSDEQYKKDINTVKKDLETLKQKIEKK